MTSFTPPTVTPRASYIVQLLLEQDIVAQAVMELDIAIEKLNPGTPFVSLNIGFEGGRLVAYRDAEQERYNALYAELNWVEKHCPVLLDTARVIYKRFAGYDFS